jgi:hypothetical protein
MCPYLLIMHSHCSIAFDVILVTLLVVIVSLNNQGSNTMILKILPILGQVDKDYAYERECAWNIYVVVLCV